MPAGEEQAKVEVLTARLEELGEDVDKLLEAVAAADDDEDEQQDAAQHEDGELLEELASMPSSRLFVA
jgi:hypothetical protein